MTRRLATDLRAENRRLREAMEQLRQRADEADQALDAIRTGQAESLIVEGPNGPRVFSLEGADHSYRVLIEAMNEGAATIGANGTILYANPRFAAMLDAPLERVMGSAILRFVTDRDRQRFEALVHGASEGERRTELELLGETGQVVPCQLSVSVMQDGDAQLFCLVAADLRLQKRNEALAAAEELARSLLVDTERRAVATSLQAYAAKLESNIAEQQRLQDTLRHQNEELDQQNRVVQEANRLKSEFLANMSHELRTPLNGIIGLAALMHDGKVGAVSADHKEYLGDILTSSAHLLQLVNDVLDLAKIESGTIELRPEPVDVARLIDDVCHIVRAISAEKRIRLTCEIDPTVAHVVLDAAKLKQVLYNFLSNALKFTPDDGTVVIRAVAEEPAQLRLEVRDSGIGIRAEDFGRLFAEFQQLDASAAKKYQGTGLGLALTRRLVEAQGGQVGLTSAHGQGSTFFAILPLTSGVVSTTARTP